MDLVFVFLILIPIGLAVGIFGALTGLGGGVLMVPILSLGIFLFSNLPSIVTSDYELKYATTISSTVIVFIAISGSIAFGLQKKIDYTVGLVSAPFAMIGSYLGKLAQSKINDTFVLYFIVVLLLATAARMIYKVVSTKRKAKMALINQKEENPSIDFANTNDLETEPKKVRKFIDKLTLHRVVIDDTQKEWQYSARLYLTPINLIGGFVASMAGVGGGIVVVPVLNLLIGLPIHFSTATSVFIMLFTKSITVISSYTNDAVITQGIWWPYVAGLAIGIIIGAQFGALFAKKIRADPLKLTFAIAIALIAVWYLVDEYAII